MAGLIQKKRFKVLEGQERILVSSLKKLKDHRDDFSKFINEYLKDRFEEIPTKLVYKDKEFSINTSNTLYKYLINGDGKKDKRVTYWDINKLLYYLVTVDTYARDSKKSQFLYNYSIDEINKILTECIDTSLANNSEFRHFRSLVECFSQGSIFGECTLHRNKAGFIYIDIKEKDEVKGFVSLFQNRESKFSLPTGKKSNYELENDIFIGNPLKEISRQILKIVGKKYHKIGLLLFMYVTTFVFFTIMALALGVFFKNDVVDYPLSYSWISMFGCLIFSYLSVKAIEGSELLSKILSNHQDDMAIVKGLSYKEATTKKKKVEYILKEYVVNEKINLYVSIFFGFTLAFMVHLLCFNDGLCEWTEACYENMFSLKGFSVLGCYHFIISILLYAFLYNLVISMFRMDTQVNRLKVDYILSPMLPSHYYKNTFSIFSKMINKYIQILIGIIVHGLLILGNVYFLQFILDYDGVYLWQIAYMVFILTGGSSLAILVFRQKKNLSHIVQDYKKNLVQLSENSAYIENVKINNLDTEQQKVNYLINLPENINNNKIEQNIAILSVLLLIYISGLIHLLFMN